MRFITRWTGRDEVSEIRNIRAPQSSILVVATGDPDGSIGAQERGRDNAIEDRQIPLAARVQVHNGHKRGKGAVKRLSVPVDPERPRHAMHEATEVWRSEDLRYPSVRDGVPHDTHGRATVIEQTRFAENFLNFSNSQVRVGLIHMHAGDCGVLHDWFMNLSLRYQICNF
jgi:hypothetical protein